MRGVSETFLDSVHPQGAVRVACGSVRRPSCIFAHVFRRNATHRLARLRRSSHLRPVLPLPLLPAAGSAASQPSSIARSVVPRLLHPRAAHLEDLRLAIPTVSSAAHRFASPSKRPVVLVGGGCRSLPRHDGSCDVDGRSRPTSDASFRTRLPRGIATCAPWSPLVPCRFVWLLCRLVVARICARCTCGSTPLRNTAGIDTNAVRSRWEVVRRTQGDLIGKNRRSRNTSGRGEHECAPWKASREEERKRCDGPSRRVPRKRRRKGDEARSCIWAAKVCIIVRHCDGMERTSEEADLVYATERDACTTSKLIEKVR